MTSTSVFIIIIIIILFCRYVGIYLLRFAQEIGACGHLGARDHKAVDALPPPLLLHASLLTNQVADGGIYSVP
jgi:hypothetical protein